MRSTLSRRPMSHRQRGFTVVETTVTIAIAGLLAAISIPLTLNAINRAKQARTMANMRAVAMAWEARFVDVKAYNAAGARYPIPPRVSSDNLEKMLTPTYIRNLPIRDGWGWLLDFRLEVPLEVPSDAASDSPSDAAPDRGTDAKSDSRSAAKHRNKNKRVTTYAIRSLGRDGILQGNGRYYTVGTTTNFDCDIIFAQGTFMVYPAGQNQ